MVYENATSISGVLAVLIMVSTKTLDFDLKQSVTSDWLDIIFYFLGSFKCFYACKGLRNAESEQWRKSLENK